MTFLKNHYKAILACAVLYLWAAAVFQVNETERAVVLQMGRPLYEVSDAGLHVKAPWPIQSAKILEKRVILYNANPREVITSDKKTMVVDTFSYFQIENGIKFMQGTFTEQKAQARVDDTVYSEMRNELSTKDFEDILTTHRVQIMEAVTTRADKRLEEYGLRTPIVRMNKADLPAQNKGSVYGRMVSERQRQAKQYRSEGDEEATKIRADTDREITVLLSEATRDSQKARGEGDAEATRIYNEAYGRDPEFFRAYRGLEAAKKALMNGGDIRIIQDGTEPHLKAIFGK